MPVYSDGTKISSWRVVQLDNARYLELTIEGKQWIANLYSHVFTVEHQRRKLGPLLVPRGGERS